MPAAAPLRFRDDGTFTILQVADMHIGNGASSPCVDLTTAQRQWPCSDLNTTAFVRRLIASVQPDLVAFTGDNIFDDAADPDASMQLAFSPAIESATPWFATLGNHDDKAGWSRAHLMRRLTQYEHCRATVGPVHAVHNGAGTYVLDVYPAADDASAHAAALPELSLYVLDSGGDSAAPGHEGEYDWFHPDQVAWFSEQAAARRKAHLGAPPPALAFFHIPLPEYAAAATGSGGRARVGEFQEPVSTGRVNAGMCAALVKAGDVRAVLAAHDHLNDFCAPYHGVQLCYAGGVGYHAYGLVGWARRARVIAISRRGLVGRSYKLLDTDALDRIDEQVLWDWTPAAGMDERNRSSKPPPDTPVSAILPAAAAVADIRAAVAGVAATGAPALVAAAVHLPGVAAAALTQPTAAGLERPPPQLVPLCTAAAGAVLMALLLHRSLRRSKRLRATRTPKPSPRPACRARAALAPRPLSGRGGATMEAALVRPLGLAPVTAAGFERG